METVGANVVTRRRLIGLGVGGGAALALTAGGPASALARVSATIIPNAFSRSTYTPLVGAAFTVKGLSSSLRLVAIGDVPFRPAGSDLAFTLSFDAPARVAALPGDPPLLSHPKLGRFSMFLTPGAVAGGRMVFTATVDRTYG
jgi:hypothetical protein